jgi:Spy/CpxP family protein refolding chaperone
MKLTKISLIAALVMGGLLAGGTLASAQQTNAAPTNAAPKKERRAFSVDRQVAEMKEQLKLTDDQVPKVKALLEQGMKDRQELANVPQDQRREKMTALREEQNKKFKEILTPEQFEKFHSMHQGFGKKAPATPPAQGAPQQ